MIRKTPLKRYTPLNRVPIKRKNPEKKAPDLDLQQYYKDGIAASTWICEECGNPILHHEEWRMYAAQCHILPKEKYHSIRAHPLNRVHLCLMCHENFDSSWLKAKTMKVFGLAMSRLKQIIHMVTERLPKALNDI